MTLCLRNRSRACGIALDLRFLRRILRYILDRYFKGPDHELCFHFVEKREMARINEEFLDHIGATDVITFPSVESSQMRVERSGSERSALNAQLKGEIFICPEVAVAQAKEFRTSWQEETVRYVIHGLLHLRGHDDLAAGPRRQMKREEERILADVVKQFSVGRLRRPPLK
jgi:probable rRNA maturation factor